MEDTNLQTNTPALPTTYQEEISRMLRDRRDALLMELSGIERQLGVSPTTAQIRALWRAQQVELQIHEQRVYTSP